MNKLEEIVNKIELEITKNISLNKEQIIDLIKVCYIYENLKIKPGSFHEIRYKTYNFSYLLNEVKKGKNYLEIMNKILDECDKYSKDKIIEKHVNMQKN
jgi:alpha-mannosidase